MILLAIDPGPDSSGAVFCSFGDRHVRPKVPIVMSGGLFRNSDLIEIVRDRVCSANSTYLIAMEGIACMGQLVGQSTLRTSEMIGACLCSFYGNKGLSDFRDRYVLTRPEIKLHLCGTCQAKDKNVRQALIDRYPARGGGSIPQIGTIKNPGPLYGIKTHTWSALAVAVVWYEKNKDNLEGA